MQLTWPVRLMAVLCVLGVLSAKLCAMVDARALVRHAPNINGTIEGSVQQMLPESVALNGGARITEGLLLPGTPKVRLNGKPALGGSIDGAGAEAPSTHQVTLNGGAALGRLVRRTDAVALPTVAAPPMPSGTRHVTLDTPGQSVGDWSTVRNLTLNGNAGQIAIPPGTYGDFTANGGSTFTLGVAGSNRVAVYHFQRLTLNGRARIDLAGPAVVVVAETVSTSGAIGSEAHPGWLAFNIANGGLTLNGGAAFSGYLLAPRGTVVVNGSARLTGGVIADRIVVNGGGLVRLIENAKPTVVLTAPPPDATFVYPASVSLAATASDPDGIVFRVEFYDGAQPLGEGTWESGATYRFELNSALPGVHRFTARVYDNLGEFADSSEVTISVVPSLPYTANFETADGYKVGPLGEQLAWEATGEANVVTGASFTGEQSVALAPATPPSEIVQNFAPLPDQRIVFADLFVRPAVAAATSMTEAPRVVAESATVAFVQNGTMGELAAFNGDGVGGGTWWSSGYMFSLNTDGRAAEWLRFTVREDFLLKTWDLYVNGRMIMADLRFRDAQAELFSRFAVAGHASRDVGVDDLHIGTDNPIFADTDKDGMDDAYERANGLSPQANDRVGDRDGDGLSNLAEYLRGTRADVADTDGDGLPDGWEVRHGLDPMANDADIDPDGDGLSNLQEYLAGTDPKRGDTDGDGLPDGWEVANATDPLASDADSDPDHDQLTNAKEFAHGTNPKSGDTDNDRLPDGWEVAHGLNPLEDDAASDHDGDHLNNLMEYLRGRDPSFDDRATDPKLAGGGDSSLWIDETGVARTWGRNQFGQLGDRTVRNRQQMAGLADLPAPVSAAAVSETHSLAITRAGQIYAWGDNSFGQLGDGTRRAHRAPAVVDGLDHIVQVVVGDHHSLALRGDGTVWAWGANQRGQLGDGTTDVRTVPVQVPGLIEIASIAAGAHHSAAVGADGRVWAWGANDFGQLADDATTGSLVPRLVSGVEQAIVVVSGRHHLLALARNGRVWAWGANNAGQLGIGTQVGQSLPQPVLSLTGVRALAAGVDHTLALDGDGVVWTWGANGVGQLGDGTVLSRATPEALTLVSVRDVACGRDHAIARMSDGNLWAWGLNTFGQLGAPTAVESSRIPVEVEVTRLED